MILRDSILDASTMKAVLKGLIRRADTFGKTREDILMELNAMIEDIDTSIDMMDTRNAEAI